MSRTSIQSVCSGKLCVKKSRCKMENCVNHSHHMRRVPNNHLQFHDYPQTGTKTENYELQLPVEASYTPHDAESLIRRLNERLNPGQVVEPEKEEKTCSDKCETIDSPNCPNCGKLLPCACGNPSNSRGLQCGKRWCKKCPKPACSVPKVASCLTSCTCVPNLQISCGPGSAVRSACMTTSKVHCACKEVAPVEARKEPEPQIEGCNCEDLQAKLFKALQCDSGANNIKIETNRGKK